MQTWKKYLPRFDISRPHISARKALKLAITVYLSTYCTGAHAAENKHFNSTGTAFFITHDGYALTANHVIEHCNGDIGLHGRELVMKARLIATDKPHDLALLKLVPDMQITNIAYFYPPQNPIKKGDPVVAIGYPRSTDDGGSFPEFATNHGHVISTDDYVLKNGEKPLMINNITEQGYSGGPILDGAGNIVGITLAGTCLGKPCREAFARATAGNIDSAEEKQAMDEELKKVLDANMAATIPTIQSFLYQNHVQYLEAPADNLLTVDRMAEIAEAIVNVRCPALEKDLIAGKGLVDQ